MIDARIPETSAKHKHNMRPEPAQSDMRRTPLSISKAARARPVRIRTLREAFAAGWRGSGWGWQRADAIFF